MLFKIARRNFVAGGTFNASHSIGLYQSKMENTTEPKEIMIPVPFGHIAGKLRKIKYSCNLAINVNLRSQLLVNGLSLVTVVYSENA